MYIGVGPPPSLIADPVLIFTQAGEAAGSPRQPGAVEPQRESFCFFFVLQHFLTPRAGFGRPGRGLGSGFSGSGGEMARRNRPSYSWVKISDFDTRLVNTEKYRKTSSLLSAHAGIYMPSGRARGGSGPCIGGGTPHSDDVAGDTSGS